MYFELFQANFHTNHNFIYSALLDERFRPVNGVNPVNAKSGKEK